MNVLREAKPLNSVSQVLYRLILSLDQSEYKPPFAKQPQMLNFSQFETVAEQSVCHFIFHSRF